MPEPEELANLVAGKAREDPKVQRIIQEATMFDGLAEHVGWKRLRERVRQDRQGYLSGLAERLFDGKKVTDEEIAFMRGFYKGADWILEHPAEAMKSLESAARAAWLLVELELTKQAEEASPYVDPPTPISQEEDK